MFNSVKIMIITEKKRKKYLFHCYEAKKKKICLFPVTSPNFFGSVGRKTFFFYSFFFFFFSILIGELPPSGCRIFPHLLCLQEPHGPFLLAMNTKRHLLIHMQMTWHAQQ